MIRTDKRKPSPEYPDRMVYDGQRTAQAVFNDLHAHLTSIGYIPDEDFWLDESRWGNGREFPSDGYLTNQVDYGGSEGIWLNVTMEYQENGERVYERFATGKTLGETGDDMDRMHLVASAITRAFHEDGVHARYVVTGGTPAPEGATIHLTPEEREVIVFSLTKMREALYTDDPDYITADQLLKRINGEPTKQEQAEKGLPTQGIVFSRVQLHADTGEEADFYMPSIPRSFDNIEDDPGFIDFAEFLSAANTDTKIIDATVTVYAEGRGAPRDADEADIDRINKDAGDLDPDCDPQIAFGWFEGEKFNFAFDYDIDEQPGMTGIE